MAVADETQQMLEYSSQPAAKSQELYAPRQLREVNHKLTQLVQKDVFAHGHEPHTGIDPVFSDFAPWTDEARQRSCWDNSR